MKIYLDYVFFINFLFDFILLLSLNNILKRNAPMKKVILSSLFGAISSFMLFLKISSFAFFILKILSGIIMVILAFNFKDIKYTFLNLIYLMILSVVLGGSLYLINIELGYENVGMIFFNKDNKGLNLFILILISIIIMLIYTKTIKKTKKETSLNYEVDLYINDKIMKLKGFIDTGNTLHDPYFNKPILILNNNYNITSDRFLIVPFNTIRGSGIMKCYQVDKVFIKGIGTITNCLVGISPDKIKMSGVDIILHKDLWEEKI